MTFCAPVPAVGVDSFWHFLFPPVPGRRFFRSMLLPSVHAVLSWYTSLPAECHGAAFVMTLLPVCSGGSATESGRAVGLRTAIADTTVAASRRRRTVGAIPRRAAPQRVHLECEPENRPGLLGITSPRVRPAAIFIDRPLSDVGTRCGVSSIWAGRAPRRLHPRRAVPAPADSAWHLCQLAPTSTLPTAVLQLLVRVRDCPVRDELRRRRSPPADAGSRNSAISHR